ncbi:MAG: hypothetical protein ACOY71_02165 [Gemmatimonadota bacterium]
MGTTIVRFILVCVSALCSTPLPVPRPDPSAAILARVIVRENPSLNDAAQAYYVGRTPVIEVNSRRLRALPVPVQIFVMAHEQGHLVRGHQRPRGFARAGVAQRFRALETDADCYAARALALSNPRALRATIEWFAAQGLVPPNRYHPSGIERAGTLLACSRPVQGGLALPGVE